MLIEPEIDRMSCVEVANTRTSRLALTVAEAPIEAWVSFVSNPTSAPAPMPTDPAPPSWPATPRTVVWSEARTITIWSAPAPVLVALTAAWSPMAAVVVSSRMLTTAEPATFAEPAPPAPAAIVVRSSHEAATTATPKTDSLRRASLPSSAPVSTDTEPLAASPRPVTCA